MKNVMIVDDEIFVRLGIRSIINWEEYGYTIVCEASNGQEALLRIEQFHPDVIFTDIMMDKMDGFALIEECRKKYPHIRLIVLSSYNDFDNVRRAMKLGAEDYIFKLTAKPEEIVGILREIGDKEEMKGENQETQELLMKNLPVIKSRLIKAAIQQSYQNEAELLEEFTNLPVKTDFKKPYVALCLSVDDFYACQHGGGFPEIQPMKSSMEHIVKEVLCGDYQAETYNYDKGDVIALIHPEKGQSYRQLCADLLQKMESIAENIHRYLGVSISGSLSGECMGLGGMTGAIEQNREAMKARFIQGGGKLFVYKESQNFGDFSFPVGLGPEEWEALLSENAYEQMQQYLKTLWEFCRENNICATEKFRIEILGLYSRLRKHALQSGVPFDELRDKNKLSLYEGIMHYDLLTTLADGFFTIVQQYRECREDGQSAKGRSEIAAVRQFVRQNLEKDLSVHTAAKIANMSESYFAHQFKDETGMSFVNYVNHQRIERAEALLRQTDKKISEIAMCVGIDNPNYFSILFKKLTGRSPNECRG